MKMYIVSKLNKFFEPNYDVSVENKVIADKTKAFELFNKLIEEVRELFSKDGVYTEDLINGTYFEINDAENINGVEIYIEEIEVDCK